MTGGVSDVPVEVGGRDTISPDHCGGFGIRAVARIIDTVVLFVSALGAHVFMGAVMVVLAAQGTIDPDWQSRLGGHPVIGFVLGLAGSFIAMALSEGVGGASLGKLLLGYRVVSLDPVRPCTPMAALIRSAAYFIDALFFGFIGWSSMNNTALNQRLGDVWAGTAVVKASALPETAKPPLLVALAGIIIALVARGAVAMADIAIKVWA